MKVREISVYRWSEIGLRHITRRTPAVIPIIFWCSGGTDVSEYSWNLRVSRGSATLISQGNLYGDGGSRKFEGTRQKLYSIHATRCKLLSHVLVISEPNIDCNHPRRRLYNQKAARKYIYPETGEDPVSG